MLRLIGPKYDIDPENVARTVLGLPNFADFNSLLYMHTVIPNLTNLGLLTERTRDEWKRVGMLVENRGELPEGFGIFEA